MGIERLSKIPLWASAEREPPVYFSVRFPDLQMHLIQICRLSIAQIPVEVSGLSGIVEWIGEVENGGIRQYFENKILNCMYDRDYLSTYINNLAEILSRIGNERFENLFFETLRFFREEAALLKELGILPRRTGPDKFFDVEGQIYNRTELDRFWIDFASYARSLPNIMYIEEAKFRSSVELMVANLPRFERVRPTHIPMTGACSKSDLEFSVNLIESMISSRKAK